MSAAAGRHAGDRGGRAGGAEPGVRAGRRRLCRGAAGGEAGGLAGPGLPGGGRVESGDVAAGAGDRAPADPVGRQPPVAGGSRPAGIARPGDPGRQMRGDGVPSGTTGPPRARRNPLRPARAPVGGRCSRRSPAGGETLERAGRAGPGDWPGQLARPGTAGRGGGALRAPAAGPRRLHQLLPDRAQPGRGTPAGAGAVAGGPARPRRRRGGRGCSTR